LTDAHAPGVERLQGHIDQLRPQVMSLHHEHTTLAEQTTKLRAKLQHAQQVKYQQEQQMVDMQEEIRQLSSLQGGGGGMGDGGEGSQRTDSCGGMLQGGKQDKGELPMIA
jgi:regulator of replication initiation timing